MPPYFFIYYYLRLYSALALDTTLFVRYLGSICILALLGTVITAVVTGVLVWCVVMTGWESIQMSAVECALLGAILSATDVVIVLTLLKHQRVEDRLYTMVFGESLLNDAVSIVLFETIRQFGSANAVTLTTFIEGTLHFIQVTFLSLFLGIGMGVICCLLFKHTRMVRGRDASGAILVLLFAYAAYALAGALQQSGVVALLAAGLVLRRYAHRSLTQGTRQAVHHTVKVLAKLSERCVFVYLGLAVWTRDRTAFKPGFIFCTLVICLFARACSVYPIAWFLNTLHYWKQKRRWLARQRLTTPLSEDSVASQQGLLQTESMPSALRLPWNAQHLLWWVGLRGAVAFALSLALDAEVGANTVLQSTTLMVVLLSSLIFGALTPWLIHKLKLDRERLVQRPLMGRTRRTISVSTSSDNSDEDSDENIISRQLQRLDSSTGNAQPVVESEEETLHSTEDEQQYVLHHWLAYFERQHILPFLTRTSRMAL